jgi:hypothetical protein
MAIVASVSTDPHICQPGCPDWPTDAEPKTEREQMFRWTPSTSMVQTLLRAAGAGAAFLGLLGFGLSFRSVASAATPYLGGWSFVLPVIIDLGIAVLTLLGLTLALAGMPSRLVSAIPTLLSAYTLYLNCADQRTVYGAIIHGAGPLMWILVVEIGGLTVRKLVPDLERKRPRIERLRPSLWFLRPVPTFLAWRKMRVRQIPTYEGVLAHDDTRASITGQMRLHYGRMWRVSAPLAERIGLRLQGRGAEGVTAGLAEHHAIVAALVNAAEPAPEAPAAPAAEPVPATAPAPAQPATAPASPAVPQASKAPAAKRVRQTPGAGRVRTATVHTDAELADLAEAAERAALAASNGASGLSYRAAQAELHTSYPKAKAALDTARERIAAKPLHLVQNEGQDDAEAVA